MNELKNLISEFLNQIISVRNYSKHTIKAYQTDLNEFYNFCSDYDINEINRVSKKVIKNFLIHLNERELNAASIGRKLTVLRQFFQYALANDKILKSPIDNASSPKIKRMLPDIISVSNFDEIVENIDKYASESKEKKVYQAIFELLYGCSLRVSEVCSLKVSDVDLNRKVLRIIGKGNKTRNVPIGDKSLQVFEEYLNEYPSEDSSLTFIRDKKNKPFYERKVHRIVNKYLSQSSEIKKKSPHILRHSSATHMLDRGASLLAIKEILGHSNLSTTQIYTQVSIERLKKIYKKSHPKS